MPHAQEVAAVVDARNGVELGHGLGCNAAGPEDTGVRHEHVEPAVAPYDRVEAGSAEASSVTSRVTDEGPAESELARPEPAAWRLA